MKMEDFRCTWKMCGWMLDSTLRYCLRASCRLQPCPWLVILVNFNSPPPPSPPLSPVLPASPSKDAFLGIMEFFRYAVPSAVMICLKWWSVEIVILLSGVLPNAKLETSVLSICMMVSGLHFSVPYGLGVAASTRVANELGAGNPRAAQLAVWVVMSLAVIETIIVSTTVFSCRHILGRAFSNEKQVVDYISILTPFICLSIVTDSIQATISGIARGCGWQKIGAYVNLVAFYLFGLPAAVVLGFPLHLKAKGLWLGIVIGSIIQAVVLSLITGLTNWQKQANKARERMSSVTPAEGSAVDS